MTTGPVGKMMLTGTKFFAKQFIRYKIKGHKIYNSNFYILLKMLVWKDAFSNALLLLQGGWGLSSSQYLFTFRSYYEWYHYTYQKVSNDDGPKEDEADE